MNVAALQRFLREQGVEARGELRVELISGGRSNLTFAAFDDVSKWVVRRPPVTLTRSAHDMAREFTVTRALRESVRILAELHAVDPDEVGLGTFGRPAGFVARQVKLWAGQWDG